jgi:hypothetical protein
MFERIIFLVLCLFCRYSSGISQNTGEHSQSIDEKMYKIDEAQVEQIYQSTFFNPLGYVNGREYKPYHYPGKPTPYFKGEAGKGSVFIEENEYDSLALIYDINLDELITIPNCYKLANYYVKIEKAVVDSFAIQFENESYLLKHLRFPANSPMLNGYYEVPYDREFKLLIFHHVTISNSGGYKLYNYAPLKYIYANGEYHRLTSKRKFLKLFPNQRKSLKYQISTYASAFRSLKKNQLADLIQFAESM